MLATKFGWEMSGADGVPDAPRGSREYIRWAVEGSLRRLRVERIDLYQYHRPDGMTPIAETLAALDELVGEGLVGAIGCSNFTAAELEEAERHGARAGPGALRHRAERIQPAGARDRGRGGARLRAPRDLDPALLPARQRPAQRQVPARRAGARGQPAVRPEQAGSDEQFDVVEALEAYAEARGVGLIDVAIAGLAAQTGGRLGDRRGDQARAGRRQRRRAALEPERADLAELDRIAPTARR